MGRSWAPNKLNTLDLSTKTMSTIYVHTRVHSKKGEVKTLKGLPQYEVISTNKGIGATAAFP